MEKTDVSADNINLNDLCNTVRELIQNYNYLESEWIITEAMGKYPHAPEPHNLMGVLLERKNDHSTAMKHFRAAWALDPSYLPARYNMEQYGDFFSNRRKAAFDDADCPQEVEKDLYKTEYDINGVGHIVKRTKNDSMGYKN